MTDLDTEREEAQKTQCLVGCLVLVGLFGCAGLIIVTPLSNLLIFVFGA